MAGRQPPSARAFFVELADGGQASGLVRFLERRHCAARREGESRVVVEDWVRDSPGLATLVALVDEWRCAERIPEAALELAGRRTILRTEV